MASVCRRPRASASHGKSWIAPKRRVWWTAARSVALPSTPFGANIVNRFSALSRMLRVFRSWPNCSTLRKIFRCKCIRLPAVANELGGEPKSEFWYFADAAPKAEIFAGLHKSSTRGAFVKALKAGKRAGATLIEFQSKPATRSFFRADGCMRSALAISSSRSSKTATRPIAFSIGIGPEKTVPRGKCISQRRCSALTSAIGNRRC